MTKKQYWVRCEECGYEMDADLDDCSCEQCEAMCWSEPYDDDGKPKQEGSHD